MSRALHLILSLLLLPPGLLAVPLLLQSPTSGPGSAGQTARLECGVQNLDVASYGGQWYRQRPADRPEFVLVHWASGSINRGTGVADRFVPSRDTSTNSYILTIDRLEPRDAAVYYCAVRETDEVYYFGGGTILDIKSSESRKPSLLLLPPSPEETGSGTATLSCLVSSFKPGLVALRWAVGGVETENGVTTGAVSPDAGQTFRLSSYLRVPAAAWNKGSSYSCSVSHSSLSSPLRHTVSASACPH
ncbi:immunoglobulin lambda-1 light chain-like [Amblyraja radiata]|uniref:immunoglobulin lambda-1 light chain-like n=1 Tax=Amblyraja radiata TaxID=386614 RepID=UPI0014021184|nr:immunoglobulin lambda-1 light chain-like [Amblyraja radiata]